MPILKTYLLHSLLLLKSDAGMLHKNKYNTYINWEKMTYPKKPLYKILTNISKILGIVVEISWWVWQKNLDRAKYNMYAYAAERT